jgi:branched-chain amino acid transport system ATP-binding protein
VINGFYTPQHGRIMFKGETRTKMRPYDAATGGIARTFQNVALFRGMTALDNIMAGRSLRMHSNFFWQLLRHGPAMTEEVEHRRKVEDIIEFLEIAHIRKVPVGVLPYGLQKRVELGRALAMEPDLLLLDEITSALDPELVAEVLDVIRELAGGGMTMVIATHEMGFARDIANRIAFLDAGRILELGPPEQLLREPREARTRQFLQRIVDAGRL